jgi:Cd2+/Zn2+-exporting ATPase
MVLDVPPAVVRIERAGTVMDTESFKIQGLHCAEEVAVLRAEFAPIEGVRDLAFDILNSKLTVSYTEPLTSAEIVSTVAKTGMRADPWVVARTERSAQAVTRGRDILTALSGVLLFSGWFTHCLISGWRAAVGHGGADSLPLVTTLLYFGATIAGAWYVAPKAWRALLRLRPDMNLLMLVAVCGAIAINELFEAATVSFLFSLSLALESWSVGRARRAISALISLTPDRARVLNEDGSESMRDVADVGVGTKVVVFPGEKVPLDGQVSKGETTINQAPITGESLPVAKNVGDLVFAGTINQDGAIELVSTKPVEDTTLARIIRMVGDAQSKRSPSEQWVERFARYYTPIVMVLAVIVALIPPLLFNVDWWQWIYNGLVLLVIACPCALVISTPVSIVAGLTAAARHGVLVKGGTYMELPARLRAIAVDKTGTLTAGRPEVVTIVSLSGHTEDEVLSLAATIESRSEHPLAHAILQAAKLRGIRPSTPDNFQAVKGKGATATVGGKSVWIGSHRLLEERGQESKELHERVVALERQGLSVVVLGEGNHVCGLIAVGDRLRPEARTAVEELRRDGIERIVMLTGDNEATGETIGREASVDEVRAELLPEDKVAAIESLVQQFGTVAMVGDGVNDAPAMARASMGIAMGAVGTDTALETADVALMGDDLRGVAWLIRHSRRTVAVIRQNILASLGVKVVFVLLTLFGYSLLWAAIAADMGASLLVIFNGLRLLRPKGASESVA